MSELKLAHDRVLERELPGLPCARQAGEWRLGRHESGARVDVEVMRSERGGIRRAGGGRRERIRSLEVEEMVRGKGVHF